MRNQHLAGKRIVFFTPESLPSYAGAGINAYAFAKYLSEYAEKVTLCCLNYNNQLPKSEIQDKLCINRLPYSNKSFIHKLFSFPFLLLHYFKNIQHAEVVLIYSGYLIGFQYLIFLSSLLGRKVIFRSSLLGGDDPESLLSRNLLIRIINRIVLKRLSIYFAINPSFASQLKVLFGNKIEIIESYQGVNVKRYHPCGAEYKSRVQKKLLRSSKELILLSVGILLKKKGFHLIFPELAKLDFPFRYIIAGEYTPSPYHNLSSKEISEMQFLYQEGTELLGEKISFIGPVNNIEDYYHAADIFLMPSLQEGTPNALLEAMACGLPCITSQLEGLAGTLTLHNINSIEFNKPEKLPQLIRNLAKNPEQMARIGLNATQTIAENYTFDKVASKLFSSLND